ACGRMMPLQENSAVLARRMISRTFGTDFVARYAFNGTAGGFPETAVRKLRRANERELFRIQLGRLAVRIVMNLCQLVSPAFAKKLEHRQAWKPPAPVYSIAGWTIYTQG